MHSLDLLKYNNNLATDVIKSIFFYRQINDVDYIHVHTITHVPQYETVQCSQ